MKGTLSTEIAEPYAQALMSLAQSHQIAESLGDEVSSLLNLLESSQDLREFIDNPIVKATDKKAVLGQIVTDEGSPYFLNFLKLLVDKGRILFLGQICQQYLELLRQQTNTVLAEVTSASELTDTQRHRVADKVKDLTGARAVELKTRVDPDLIGGVIIKIGSQVFDTSLRGQLRRISISLEGAG